MTETLSKDEIKANRLKWIEDLESGKWKQCRSAWNGKNIKGEMCHCCLDVANKVLSPECGYDGFDQAVYRTIFIETTSKRLGITDIGDFELEGSMQWFVKLNDRYNYDFNEIAKSAREFWGLPKS